MKVIKSSDKIKQLYEFQNNSGFNVRPIDVAINSARHQPNMFGLNSDSSFKNFDGLVNRVNQYLPDMYRFDSGYNLEAKALKRVFRKEFKKYF